MIYYESRRPHTAHTTNPVPFILVSNKQKKIKLRNSGILADVALCIKNWYNGIIIGNFIY